MNALIVCANYDDFLAITLPCNRRHFDRILVVTTPQDHATQLLADSQDNTFCHTTDVFGRIPLGIKPLPLPIGYQALKAAMVARTGGQVVFNKGAAIEEGLDVLGRSGWICLLDADVILPEIDLAGLEWEPGCLYGPYRRLCETAEKFRKLADWSRLPYGPEKDQFPNEFAGYCQIFDSAAPHLKRPWYACDWPAEGPDSEFWWHWPAEKRRRPKFEVLHLGPLRVNWRGRVSPRWE